MFKRGIILLFSCGLLCAAGCDLFKPKARQSRGNAGGAASYTVSGPVVATVNNYPISAEDLNQEINAYNSMVPPDKADQKITTSQQKLDYLKNELVRRILLFQDAQAKGLDRKPEITQALEKTKQDLLVMELVKQEAENVAVSNTDVEEYYNQYKDQLREPEERQIREIVVNTDQEGKDILIQLLQGADFATLAKDRSIAPSKANGGDIGFYKGGKKFPQFDQEAFAANLDIGKTSSFFKGPDGVYIIKLEAKRGGKPKPLTELYEDIKKGLTFMKQQKKIDDLVGKISREAKIEIHESEIK